MATHGRCSLAFPCAACAEIVRNPPKWTAFVEARYQQLQRDIAAAASKHTLPSSSSAKSSLLGEHRGNACPRILAARPRRGRPNACHKNRRSRTARTSADRPAAPAEKGIGQETQQMSTGAAPQPSPSSEWHACHGIASASRIRVFPGRARDFPYREAEHAVSRKNGL